NVAIGGGYAPGGKVNAVSATVAKGPSKS
ncbi:hypothetical protein EV129_120115, partial [Rhizobium azibense]